MEKQSRDIGTRQLDNDISLSEISILLFHQIRPQPGIGLQSWFELSYSRELTDFSVFHAFGSK